MNDTQANILKAFGFYKLLTPDDAADVLGCFTCSIREDFEALVDTGILEPWSESNELDFESTIYRRTQKPQDA